MNKMRVLTILGVLLLLDISVCFSNAFSFTPDEIYLNQRETINMIINSKGGKPECRIHSMVGIGAGHPKSGKTAYDAIMIASFPPGFQFQDPSPGTIETKTIYDEPFSIPYKYDTKDGSGALSFTLKNVPTLDLSEPGKCCGPTPCDMSCASACSVEFSYSVMAEIPQDKWGVINCSHTPSPIPVNEDTTVTVFIETRDLTCVNPEIMMYVPNRIAEATLRLVTPPKLFSVNNQARSSALTKKNPFTHEKVEMKILVHPNEKMDIVVPSFIRIRGATASPMLPAPQVQGYKDLKLTRSSSVVLNYPLEIKVK